MAPFWTIIKGIITEFQRSLVAWQLRSSEDLSVQTDSHPAYILWRNTKDDTWRSVVNSTRGQDGRKLMSQVNFKAKFPTLRLWISYFREVFTFYKTDLSVRSHSFLVFGPK